MLVVYISPHCVIYNIYGGGCKRGPRGTWAPPKHQRIFSACFYHVGEASTWIGISLPNLVNKTQTLAWEPTFSCGSHANRPQKTVLLICCFPSISELITQRNIGEAGGFMNSRALCCELCFTSILSQKRANPFNPFNTGTLIDTRLRGKIESV